MAIFDASKNLIAADTTTYPSLTELAYVKGAGSSILGKDDTGTFTNKAIKKRVVSEASNTAPSINVDVTDLYVQTALAGNITGFTFTGTPTDGQELKIRITDNGTARALAHGASVVASGLIALPTITQISTTIEWKLEYDGVKTKWEIKGVA